MNVSMPTHAGTAAAAPNSIAIFARLDQSVAMPHSMANRNSPQQRMTKADAP